jgi:hypothetical protein
MKGLVRLEQALRRKFLVEDTVSLAALLSKASLREKISFEEIGVKKEAKEDFLLFLCSKRLLIPARTSQVSRSLAWENRLLIVKPGETYEMPNVVGCLVEIAEESGEWKPDYAVKRYLEHVGEKEAEKIVRLFRKLKEKMACSAISSRTNKVTPELLKECSEELGLNLDIDRTIAELKGGGVISPRLRGFLTYGIRYEINPSLL